MFEHMAFKGTRTIGTKNWPAEKKAMDAVERVYDRLEAERNKGVPRRSRRRSRRCEAELKAAIEKADSLRRAERVRPRSSNRTAASDMNAGTGRGFHQLLSTAFPSNRIELWFLLESQRFLHPVFREFYKERDVVREERRMRVESSPQGKLVEALLGDRVRRASLSQSSPADGPAISRIFRASRSGGVLQDNTTRPANITIGIAGDVNPAEARRLAEKYFGRLPRVPRRRVVRTVEPAQEGEKRVEVASPAQPFLAIAYKRPDEYDKDDAVFDVLERRSCPAAAPASSTRNWCATRRSRWARSAQPTFPGGQVSESCSCFSWSRNRGHTVEENEKEFYEIIEQLKNEKVDDATLEAGEDQSCARR